MDNSNNLTLAQTGVPGGGAIDSVASIAKNLAADARNKSKLKTAKANLAAGRLNNINAFSVQLLIGAGVSSTLYTQIPAFQTDPGFAELRAQLGTGIIVAKNADGTNVPINEIDSLKKYIPWILGAIVVGVLIYFITK